MILVLILYLQTEREVINRPPTEFVKALRAHCENRQRLVQLGRYLLVAVGMFGATWTVWRISTNWDAFVLDPLRGVVVVGGVAIGLSVALFMHRRAARRVEQELVALKGLDREFESSR